MSIIGNYNININESKHSNINGDYMIVYDPLWRTMKEKNISQYKLIKEYNFSTGQLDRLRKNGNVSTYTLNVLCEILDCSLNDIVEYKKSN